MVFKTLLPTLVCAGYGSFLAIFYLYRPRHSDRELKGRVRYNASQTKVPEMPVYQRRL